MSVQPLFVEQTPDQRLSSLDFDLPRKLEASEPPEARGFERDEVRLLVSYKSDGRVVHARFRELGDFLKSGDVLVINTSGTMNAALEAEREDGTKLELHLSTRLPADLWTVRSASPKVQQPSPSAARGPARRSACRAGPRPRFTCPTHATPAVRGSGSRPSTCRSR